MVEADVRADQRLHRVEDARVAHRVVERLVVLDRVEDPAHVVLAVVAARDRELLVVLGQPLRLFEHLGQGRPQHGDLVLGQQLGMDDVSLLVVERLLLDRRHPRRVDHRDIPPMNSQPTRSDGLWRGSGRGPNRTGLDARPARHRHSVPFSLVPRRLSLHALASAMAGQVLDLW